MDATQNTAELEKLEEAVTSWIPKELLQSPAAIRVLVALGILAAGFVVIKIIVKLLSKGLKKTSFDEALHHFIINCIKIILWVVILITVLGYVGVPVSSFIAIIGASGIAIALALQDSLANFAGGLIIMFTKPFKKGDFIEDLNVSGKVEKIDLLYSTLATMDNKIITIPNGKLANSTIINYSKADYRRVDCTFGIGFRDDIGKAKVVLERVAKKCATVLEQPPMIIGVSNHGDSAIELDLKVWCKNDDYWDTKYYLEEQVKLAFDEEKINIPYQTVTVRFDESASARKQVRKESEDEGPAF